jgi:hypothetical protein
MVVAVMGSAQRHRELVAYLASHCAGLREPQMVGVSGASPADKTRRCCHEFEMGFVPMPTRLADRELAFFGFWREHRRGDVSITVSSNPGGYSSSRFEAETRRPFAMRAMLSMETLRSDRSTPLGPGIRKPPGMSDRVFDKLNYQLTKEHICYMCARLGKPDPEFYDEEPPPPKHPPRLPRRDNVVGDQSIYFRDKSGTLKMRTKFKKKFGFVNRYNPYAVWTVSSKGNYGKLIRAGLTAP